MPHLLQSLHLTGRAEFLLPYPKWSQHLALLRCCYLWHLLRAGTATTRRDNPFQGLTGGLSLVPLITYSFYLFYSVE